MAESMEREPRLVSLFADALRASEKLLSFSQQKHSVFTSADDDAITEALKEREGYINALTSLENDIDLVLDEDDPSYSSLPPEAEKIRSSIRSVLCKVTELDTEAINTLSGNLQKYKDYTIRARNKKHISAYIRTSVVNSSGSNLNLAH